jgi:hypothetical protein
MENLLTLAAAAMVLVSAGGVALVTQLLKWKVIAYPASRYPVPTAAALSVVAGLFGTLGIGLKLDNLVAWIVFVVLTFVLSTQIYDVIVKLVTQLKQN